jgi:hypothetical protein
VEERKLRGRPQTWRLACQALVESSVLVVTRPQLGLQDREALVENALGRPLPPGPTAWPAPPEPETPDAEADSDGAAAASDGGPVAEAGQTATSGEVGGDGPERR